MSESPQITQSGLNDQMESLDTYGDSPLDENRAGPYAHANRVVISYLKKNVPIFQRLAQLREEGWNNRSGDKFFQKQRATADTRSAKQQRQFFRIMKEIGEQIHTATSAFELRTANTGSAEHRILDFCMAPGGFLSTALRYCKEADVLAFSLPISAGGHESCLPWNPNVTLRFLDITMLAADMGVRESPMQHPDAMNFRLQPEFAPYDLFDLVICDGQVLRTHARAAYREVKESTRLLTVQLALGLEHLRPGGTMVILLHKAEAWDTVSLLYTFDKFSRIQLFKPTPYHAKRSSFYMVAQNVQSLHVEAGLAIERWKESWRTATFVPTDGDRRSIVRDDLSPENLLEEFGPKFMRLASPIWTMQAEALARAPFITSQR